MQLEKLEKILGGRGEPRFRLQQIKKAVYQDGVSSFAEISTLSKDLRQVLEKELKILPFKAEKILVAKDGSSVKALLKLEDGQRVETVLLQAGAGKWSVCLSCQVGCPLNCAFCATGGSGFQRNLTAEEIVGQVLFWQQNLKTANNTPHPGPLLSKERGRISNIVYMGMGEPFLNWKEVSESLRELIDKDLCAFGSRSISVSTAGIPEGIEALAKEFPQVNLALSLHFATDEKRDRCMPVNKKFDLAQLKKALQAYLAKTNRQVFIEYVLLADVNGSENDAYALATYLKSIGKRQLLHVNLIGYNETGGSFRAPSGNRLHQFQKYLENNGLSVTIRKSLGQEVRGACGQLAGKS